MTTLSSPPTSATESHLLEEEAEGEGKNGFSGAEDGASVSTYSVGHDHQADGTGNGMLPKSNTEHIAQQENRAVFWLRMLVLLILIASAVTVSVVVYWYMNEQEIEEFHAKLDSDARKIFQSVGATLDQTLGSTDAMIAQLFQYAEYSNSAWPFVTVPFGLQAAKLLKLSKAFQCRMGLFVEPDQTQAWSSYVQENSDTWIKDVLNIQANDEDRGVKYWTYTVNPSIYGFRGNLTEPTAYQGNYCPTWLQYPIVPGSEGDSIPVNWDSWQVPFEAMAMMDVVTNQRIAISPATNVAMEDADEQTAYMAQSVQTWAQDYLQPQDDASEPFTTIIAPMYERITESIRQDLTQHQPAVGVFSYSLFWRDLIRGILPSDSTAVIVVVTDPCGASFTYRLDGGGQTFLGPGDRHDTKYDSLGQALTLNEIMETTKKSEEGSAYTGIPLSETYCIKTIHVYPSQEMEDVYVTQLPTTFTIAAAMIFLFVSAIFVIYDCTVARRQRIVKERALASGAIVQSLFPEKVRKQMYEEQKQQQEQALKKIDFVVTANHDYDGTSSDDPTSTSVKHLNQPLAGSKPIADLFHNTTVYFADLVGFTSWSSKRTPTEVFELLETLYGAFDVCARRRNVFKVETIGDCYVAVTGIPEKQENHALIMVKFAHDCMQEMNRLTVQLVESLGEGTADLKMRIGIHSGSTTAGVLRGERGRFQLFGDTVNTAARMESNGAASRIHCSQATADELIVAGKKSWLISREDKIVAKGKGEMQTFWIVVPSKAKSTKSSVTTDGSIDGSIIH